MPIELEFPLPIFRVVVRKVNVTSDNGMPQANAVVQLLSSEGVVIADSNYISWGEETWKKYTELCKSIEEDFVKTLKGDNFYQWDEEPQTETEISYPNNGEWK